jgi:hypothetical protein
MAPLDKPVSMVLQSFSNFSTISTSFYHLFLITSDLVIENVQNVVV